MKPARAILQRSVVMPFYKDQAGLFLFLFFLLFGTEPSFYDLLLVHRSIIRSIIQPGVLTLVTLLIWLLYTARVLLFFYRLLQKDRYAFLFVLNSLPKRNRFRLFAVMALRLLLPVEGYGMAIIGVALVERNGPALLATPLVIGGLILAATYGMVRLTAQAQAAQEIKNRIRWKQPWITPGLFRFSTLFVFREQFAALAITKLLSFAALYYFSRPEEALYDPRMLWLIWISALMGHSVIIYRLFHFVETRLGFYRNLPIPVMRRFLSYIPLYVLLLLPEAWALLGVGVNQHQWMDYGWMLCSGPAVLLLIHSLMLSAPSDMEETMKLLAGVWLVLIFFSLSQHWWIPLLGAVFAPVLFGISYRQYEEKPEVINTE